jgi:hypothetical protein
MKSFLRVLINIEDENQLDTIIEAGCTVRGYSVTNLQTTEAVGDDGFEITKN